MPVIAIDPTYGLYDAVGLSGPLPRIDPAGLILLSSFPTDSGTLTLIPGNVVVNGGSLSSGSLNFDFGGHAPTGLSGSGGQIGGSITLRASGGLVTTGGSSGQIIVAGGSLLTRGEGSGQVVITGGSPDPDPPLLTGTRRADHLRGTGGDDDLDGARGADHMAGGGGNDEYWVDHRRDSVEESEGNGWDGVHSKVSYRLPDHVEVLWLEGRGNLRGTGNDGNNVLYGNAGRNRLDGDDGDDILDGGAGADRLGGGAGDDVYMVDHRGDRVAERADQGTDWVHASVDFRLRGNVENLTLSGDARTGRGNGLDNRIYGNDADNVLLGMGGDDELAGLGGNDTLNGSAGRDILLGGDGDDLLFFDPADVSVDGGAGTDTLRAGRGGGTLDLDAVAVSGIEVIDLTGRGAHVLHLGEEALARLAAEATPTDPTAILMIDGDSRDAVDAGFGWNRFGIPTEGPHAGYLQFVRGNVLLLVDPAVDVSGIGPAMPPITGLTMQVSDDFGNRPTRLDPAEIRFEPPILLVEPVEYAGDGLSIAGNAWTGSAGDDRFVFNVPPEMLDGGNGFDSLVLAGSGTIVGMGQIRSIELIDITGSGNNELWVSPESLAQLGAGETPRVEGDAGDILRLMGDGWAAPGGAPDGYTLFTAGESALLVSAALDIMIG